jgi:nitrate/nitrite transporter NarK
MSDNEKIFTVTDMQEFLVFGVGCAVYPFYLWWAGHVCRVLWGWFAVPLGAVSITTPQMAGVILLYGALRMHASSTKTPKGQENSILRMEITEAIALLLTLGVGAIVQRIAY